MRSKSPLFFFNKPCDLMMDLIELQMLTWTGTVFAIAIISWFGVKRIIKELENL